MKGLKPAQVRYPTGSREFHRFIGISLSGGKSDRSCIAVLDSFVHPRRIFLTRIFDRIRAEETTSADLKIHELISQFSESCQSVSFDVPLTFPKCLRCDLPCPGYEICGEPEIKWMRSEYQKLEKKKPKKMFTPYTQRCVDLHLQELEDENLEVHHALGANLGPLTARARFITRRLKLPCLEVNVRLAVWRLGSAFKVNRSHLRSFRSAVSGEDARLAILQAFSERAGVFFYEQDLRLMVESHHAFDAFLSAYVGLLKRENLTEVRPAHFPRQEPWVEIPVPGPVYGRAAGTAGGPDRR